MSPKHMVWVSIGTLIISVVTLIIVWQMQQQLAHTDAGAAVTLQTRQENCESAGGTWKTNPTGGECRRYSQTAGGFVTTYYDSNGNAIAKP